MKSNREQEAAKTETKNNRVAAIIMTTLPGTGGSDADISLDTLLDPLPPPIVPPSNEGGAGAGAAGGQGGNTPPPVVETPEQKLAKENLAKQTELKTKYAALLTGVDLANSTVEVDDKGVLNVKDKDGKIVKSVSPDAPKAVTLIGDDNKETTYKLNATGDAVDETGKVVKTKAELDALEAQQNEVALIDEIVQKAGYVVKGEDGKPKTYEDTPEGIIAYAKDIAKIELEKSQKALFDAYPKAKKYIQHLAAGGNDEQFFNVLQEDFSKVTIDENNKEQQKNIIRSLMRKRGATAAEIEEDVKFIEDANKLKERSAGALATLKTMQSQTETEKETRRVQALQAEEKRQETYWKGINKIVTEGKVAGAIIPEAKRTEFFEYMSKPIDDAGNSQDMLDADAETDETRIFTSLLRYLKYDLSLIIKDAVNAEKGKSLRSRLARREQPKGVSTEPPIPGSVNDISLDTLIPN